jgi:F-type H+-transporting ATPase subunit gamma
LNTNLLRQVLVRMRDSESRKVGIEATAIGNKGFGFLQRLGARIVSHVTGLGDTPRMDKLIGPVKIMLDKFAKGEIDAVYLCYNDFINTMKQEPKIEQLLPLSADRMAADAAVDAAAGNTSLSWDYLYEPDAQTVLDELLTRYVEALVFQAIAENMASEQSARMVAMKSASDNAKKVIDELKLVYNKARQAAITKELSEIVSGAAAV